MIRSKGEAGTGNVVEAVRHLRSIIGDIKRIGQADSAELFDWAKQLQAPLPLVQEIAETGKLPVPLFCAGGLATPADAALAMQLGAEAVFVGSGIFKSDDPAPRAAIVEATTHFNDADPRQGQPWARRPDDRHRHGRDQPALRRPRLVSRRVRDRSPWRSVATGRRRARAAGRVRRPSATPAESRRRRAVRSARPPTSSDVDALVMPGGESDDDVEAAAHQRPVRPARRAPRRRHAGVRHVRRHDPAAPARCSTVAPTSVVRCDRHHGAPQRLRPSARQLRDRPRRRRGLDAPFHGVFIRAPKVERVGAGRRGAGRARRCPCSAASRTRVRVASFHPELAERPAAARSSSSTASTHHEPDGD